MAMEKEDGDPSTLTTNGKKDTLRLRSQDWFQHAANPILAALYTERFLNYGLTREELQSGRPIIGIAQTGSDLSPCNRHHLVLADRVREGIRTAGGIAIEFPVHPIQETTKRPTASLDRNLAYLGLVEVLYGYPIDGVVLTIGCDKTTPACLMAAATVNIPAIALSVGPMLNGWYKGERTGSGTIVWKARELLAAGEYLGEDYCRAGGVPAVVAQLMSQRLIRENALTVNGRTIGENCRHATIENPAVIKSFDQPIREKAGFLVLKGNLFDSAIMKTSVISAEFRQRYLSDPKDPEAFEGRAIVFDGPEDYHKRIDDPALALDAHSILVIRGVGPIGYPGAAEVVNMRPPAYLIKQGVHALACIGDGRQSGTSGSPSILNASPEAAANGGLALLKTGDRIRVDLRKGTVNALVSDTEWTARRAALLKSGGYQYPAHQTPWQEIQRGLVDQLADGMVL